MPLKRAWSTDSGRRPNLGLQLSVALGLAAALLTLRAAPALQSASDPVVIRGATLIDGQSTEPLEDSLILIRGERIDRVGRVGDFPAPAGATVIEARGKFVIPGLIDAHVHYRDWLGEMFLAHGVTSVFDLGDPTDWILAVREATAAGKIRAPRLYVSGNLIDGERKGPRASMGGGGLHRNRHNRIRVETPQAGREAVRRHVERGVDFIKVYQDLSLDQLAAITDEAHRAGLAVVGHTDEALEAARAGLDGITHLWGIGIACMSPEERQRYNRGLIPSPYPYIGGAAQTELIRTLIDEQVMVNPLLVNEHASVNPHSARHRMELVKLLGRPGLEYVPLAAKLGILAMPVRVRNYASAYGLFPHLERLEPGTQEQFRIGYQRARQFLAEFVGQGGKLFLGTDSAGASIVPGLSVHHELELVVDSGISPFQAIQFATRAPAELIGREDEIGTVQPGRYADLVILEENPLEDISRTQSISQVLKAGRIVDRSYHSDYTNPIPYPVREFSSSENPLPVISDIDPMGAAVGASTVDVIIHGRGFVLSSMVRAGESMIQPRFVSPARLELSLPSPLLSRVGTVMLSVVNPQPGGGRSNSFGFVVAPAKRRESP